MTLDAEKTAIAPYLNLLRAVVPPNGVLVVGAGVGTGPWVQLLRQWQQPNVTLVEGDDTQYQYLARHLAVPATWRLRREVVAAAAGTATFYRASNPAESGLIDPEQLRPVWPNLSASRISDRQSAVTLQDLLGNSGKDVNWLLLDCLPAAPLLRGIGEELGKLDLVLVRVTLGDERVAELDSGLEELRSWLHEQGFRYLTMQAERHPVLAHALFVRDIGHMQDTLAAQQSRFLSLQETNVGLNEALEAQTRLATERQSQIEVLQQAQARLEQERSALAEALDEQTRLAAERQSQIEALQQERTWLEQERSVLTEVLDKQIRLAAERQSQIEALQQAQAVVEQEKSVLATGLEEQIRLVADRQAQITELKQAQAALEQEKSALTIGLGEQVRLAAEWRAQTNVLEQHIQNRQADKADLAVRQQQMQEELARAEAQLDLIKDLLLREPEKTELNIQLKKQAEELARIRKSLDAAVKKEITNATRQIEAVIGLQSYFATGELPSINTERHGWPVGPDFALYLVELLETNDYDLVIEFGSGISTVIIAKTLAKMSPRRQGKPPVQFVSFDHLEQFYQRTLAQIKQSQLAETVQLHLAPLRDYTVSNGTYPYYDCHAILAEVAKHRSPAGLRLLAVIDGPPGDTCKHARYPAGPIILAYFMGAHVDLLLDDYSREDEKEIVKLWQADFTAAKMPFITSERKLERAACLISIRTSKTYEKIGKMIERTLI